MTLKITDGIEFTPGMELHYSQLYYCFPTFKDPVGPRIVEANGHIMKAPEKEFDPKTVASIRDDGQITAALCAFHKLNDAEAEERDGGIGIVNGRTRKRAIMQANTNLAKVKKPLKPFFFEIRDLADSEIRSLVIRSNHHVEHETPMQSAKLCWEAFIDDANDSERAKLAKGEAPPTGRKSTAFALAKQFKRGTRTITNWLLLVQLACPELLDACDKYKPQSEQQQDDGVKPSPYITLTEALGIVKTPLLDDDGNPVLNAKGESILVPAPFEAQQKIVAAKVASVEKQIANPSKGKAPRQKGDTPNKRAWGFIVNGLLQEDWAAPTNDHPKLSVLRAALEQLSEEVNPTILALGIGLVTGAFDWKRVVSVAKKDGNLADFKHLETCKALGAVFKVCAEASTISKDLKRAQKEAERKAAQDAAAEQAEAEESDEDKKAAGKAADNAW